jgi:toxin-antitoxin system PIN domain toxin
VTTFLLDANVLIALTAREHVHHERVTHWAADVGRFALCPIVEGALIRFAVRLGATVVEAQQSLRLVRNRRGYNFWPDSLSYADARLDDVRGYRQVTDAYLVSLAVAHSDGILATLDEALARAQPDQAVLVPTT